MKALVVKSKDESEMKFISDLLKKLRITTIEIDVEEIEDLGLSMLMKEADRNKKVSREVVMKKLKSK